MNAVPLKLLLVAGARPNFMKVAPIVEALRQRQKAGAQVSLKLVHTGQHYDALMSDAFFADLGIPQPDINLNVGSGSHAEQTARVMLHFEPVCLAERPDWVMVVGDVNSTLACALTAVKLHIAVAHVEAGLRSGDRGMPEEINRLCTDAVSDLLFTTDELADENLLRENIPPGRISRVGNTMIDTLYRNLARARALPLPEGVRPAEFAVLTLHRPRNVDNRDTLAGLMEAIVRISRRIRVLFPVHPRTRRNLEDFGLMAPLAANENLVLMPPLGYLAFLGLVCRAKMVLTDSGGIQEETTVLGIPCITMRENTERPITCTMGTNVLTGADPGRVESAASTVLGGAAPSGRVPHLWDGHAAERIADALLARGGWSPAHSTAEMLAG